jgi:hypothetical protein
MCLWHTVLQDVPILVVDAPLMRSLVNTFDKHKVFPKERIVYWDPQKTYYADTVYFAGEK